MHSNISSSVNLLCSFFCPPTLPLSLSSSLSASFALISRQLSARVFLYGPLPALFFSFYCSTPSHFPFFPPITLSPPLAQIGQAGSHSTSKLCLLSYPSAGSRQLPYIPISPSLHLSISPSLHLSFSQPLPLFVTKVKHLLGPPSVPARKSRPASGSNPPNPPPAAPVPDEGYLHSLSLSSLFYFYVLCSHLLICLVLNVSLNTDELKRRLANRVTMKPPAALHHQSSSPALLLHRSPPSTLSSSTDPPHPLSSSATLSPPSYSNPLMPPPPPLHTPPQSPPLTTCMSSRFPALFQVLKNATANSIFSTRRQTASDLDTRASTSLERASTSCESCSCAELRGKTASSHSPAQPWYGSQHRHAYVITRYGVCATACVPPTAPACAVVATCID